MAKPEEEQRDNLFDMSLGDGLIEVDTEQRAADDVVQKTKTEEDDKPKTTGDVAQYEDGTFEIDDTPSQTTKEVSEDTDEFIEKTETEEIKTPSKTSTSDSSSSSPYLAFARDRADEGVFLDFSEENWKELKERNDGDEAAALRELSVISVREMVRAGVENFKASITDEERVLYEAKEKGLPVDEYSLAKRSYEKYSKMTEDELDDDIELQEDIVGRSLSLRGFSPDEIKEEIEGYKALENLGSKAKKALKAVPTAYKNQIDNLEQGAQAYEQSRQDGIRQRVARMKQQVENIPEIIPGIKLTKPAREKIMSSMTVPIAKDTEGNPLNPVMVTRTKNPEAFEMMIHYYHSLGLFNIDDSGQIKPDFSKIAKVQKTKAADEMRNIFETSEKSITGKAKLPEVNEDELDDFDKAFRRL